MDLKTMDSTASFVGSACSLNNIFSKRVAVFATFTLNSFAATYVTMAQGNATLEEHIIAEQSASKAIATSSYSIVQDIYF